MANPSPLSDKDFFGLTGQTVAGGLQSPGGLPGGMIGSGEITNDTRVYVGGSNYLAQSKNTKGLGGANARDFDKNYNISETGDMTYAEAKALPMRWMNEDKGKLEKLVNTGILRKVPGFKAGMGLPEIMSAWDTLLQQAWSMNTSGVKNNGKPWTPEDILNTYSNEGMNYGTIKSGDWIIDARTGERIKYVGPKSKTTTESRINLSSPEEVRALTTQMLTELLGRAPNDEEMGKYRASINGYENANPQTATTTQTLNDMGEVTNTDTKTSGGASQAALGSLVSEEAKKGPEYGKYQAGTTYFNALMQMLGG